MDDAEIKVNDQQVDISLDSNGDINVNLSQTTVAAAQVENYATMAAQTTIVTTAAPAQTAAPAEQTTAAQAVLKFTNVTADSFTVTGKYYHFGDEPLSQAFDVVRTADGFRISKAADVVYP